MNNPIEAPLSPRYTDWHSEQRAEALRLFKIVHGPGDAGSELEFNCMNPSMQSGWMRLAAESCALRNALTSINELISLSKIEKDKT